MSSSNPRISNSMVSGSSPDAPSNPYSIQSNQVLISWGELQPSDWPVTELLCLQGEKLHRVKIDTSDLPLVLTESTRWRVANFYPHGFRLYAYYRKRVKGIYDSITVYLHRVIAGDPDGLEIDHANHDSLDNRRSCNLRIVTHKQNLNNRVDHQRLRGLL